MVCDKMRLLVAQDNTEINIGDIFPLSSLPDRIRYTAVLCAFIDYSISHLSVVANYLSRFAHLTIPIRDTQNAIDPLPSMKFHS